MPYTVTRSWCSGSTGWGVPSTGIWHRKGAWDMRWPTAGGMVEEDRSVLGLEQLCPECGAPMVELERRMEDGAVFIWYACTREECTGQWLEKKAPRMCGHLRPSGQPLGRRAEGKKAGAERGPQTFLPSSRPRASTASRARRIPMPSRAEIRSFSRQHRQWDRHQRVEAGHRRHHGGPPAGRRRR